MKLSEELIILNKDCSYTHIEEFKKYTDNTDDLERIESDYCYLFSKYQNALWEYSCTNVPYIQSFFYEIGDYVQMELDEYISRIEALQETKKEEVK